MNAQAAVAGDADRQIAAAERWKPWIPVASALAAALIASATTLFALA